MYNCLTIIDFYQIKFFPFIFLATHLGNQENTRCLGNYMVKGNYKEFEDICSATQEPIIAEPDIHGGLEVDDTFQFLLLMSSGLYKSVEEATGTDQANKYIAQCVVEQVSYSFKWMGTICRKFNLTISLENKQL